MPTGVYKRTEETRKKMSVAKSGPNNPNYGMHPSDKTRKKQSEAKAGARNPMYGKHHTEEKRRRAKCRWLNSGSRHPMYGKRHTEETKAKLRLSAKKLWENPEYRKRALANLIFKGKHQTEKIKEKYR